MKRGVSGHFHFEKDLPAGNAAPVARARSGRNLSSPYYMTSAAFQRLALALLFALAWLGLPCLAAGGAERQEEIVEIREKMFLTQTNDIYINAEDYLGKTLRWQGFLMSSRDEDEGRTFYFVLRNGPGCCPGVDNTAGFEVYGRDSYPGDNAWVEAEGELESYAGPYGAKLLRVRLSSLKKLAARGADYVAR